MNKVYIFDSTLRDGAQAEGISFSVEDKLKIVERLDKLGISYIEAGNPGSNPKDLEFFERVKKMKLNNIRLTAFGSTRRVGIKAEDDNNVQSLLKADTPAVAIFGKSWDLHVTDILKTTLEENLNMINVFEQVFKSVLEVQNDIIPIKALNFKVVDDILHCSFTLDFTDFDELIEINTENEPIYVMPSDIDEVLDYKEDNIEVMQEIDIE